MTEMVSALLPAEAEDQLEDAIRTFFEGRELEIYQMMSWQLGHTDEPGTETIGPTERRLHGSLLLAVAQVLHGDYTAALKYAISVELMYNFALIHGDVQDGNTERLGRASVWWKWGPSQAINTGDGMHALARLSLFELCDVGESLERVSKALEIVDDAVLRRCEGEFLDVAFQERTSVSVSEYLDMVAMRVGSLYGASAELASIFDDDFGMERRLALRKYGENIGIVRQLSADWAAFFGGTERNPVEQGRVISKKKTLPVSYLFDSVKDPSVLRKAGEMYMQRVIDPSRISELTQLVVDAGAREFTVEQIESHLANAEAALSEAGVGASDAARLMVLARDIGDIDQIHDMVGSADRD